MDTVKRTWEIPTDLYRKVSERAKRERRSVVQEVVWLLEQVMREEQGPDGLHLRADRSR